MGKLGLVVFCLLAGVLARRFRVFPDSAASALNRFVIYFSLPAITLRQIHRLDFGGAENLAPIGLAWLLFAAAALVVYPLARAQGWSRETAGALLLTAGLGNTSFVGFALLEALHGGAALPLGVLVDQPGTFLAMATLGVGAATWLSGRRLTPLAMLGRVLRFPPFVALVLAFLLRPFAMPPAVDEALERLGFTLVPLALTAVGLELRLSRGALRREARPLLLGLGFKLVLAPLLAYAVYAPFLAKDGLPFRVIVLEAAMAPMITAGIVASEHGLRPDLASLMVGVGIPLSIAWVPFVDFLLGRLAA